MVQMNKFTVRPGNRLSGKVELQGAKNSVLKLMAACILAKGTSELYDVPQIVDVDIMAEVLTSMGMSVEKDGRSHLRITRPDNITPYAPYELVEKMRASVVVLGPMLATQRQARVSLPGGDDFGDRPIDIHIRALSELGAKFHTSHGYIEASCDQLIGTRIVLDFPSHTATDNVLMASVLAKGETVIENAAREPEIQDLAEFLTKMGAKIEGAGTSRIIVEGVDELKPAVHHVVKDRVEAATFIAAVGLAGGEIDIYGAREDYMDMLLEKVSQMGLGIDSFLGGIRVSCADKIKSVDVVTLPYPGVATDYKPLIVTMLSVGDSTAIVSENLFAGRFRYIDELRRMGADIKIQGHHALVRGVEKLSGAHVRASDIRAGAALVLAGLAADSETTVLGGGHIDRGYEHFAHKLRLLGADVEQINEEDE